MIKFKEDFIQRDTGKNILLIGNGFDLAAGLKTRFIDLLKFVVMTRVMCNYKTVLNEDKYNINTAIEDYNTYISCANKVIQIEPQKAIILNLVDNCFFKRILENIIPNWSKYLCIEQQSYNLDKDYKNRINYVYGLSEDYISSSCNSYINFQDVVHRLVKDPNNKLRTIISSIECDLIKNEKKIGLWLDVESMIELAITGDDNLKKKYEIKGSNWILDGSNENTIIFSEFIDLFEKSLHIYFSNVQDDVSNLYNFFDKVKNGYFTSLNQRYSNIVYDFVINEKTPDILINYNYTGTARKLYNINFPDNNLDIVHINGSLNSILENNDIVIGYSDSYSKQFKFQDNERINKDFLCFKKKNRRNIKNCPKLNINEILKDKFNLVILGHSCCMADSDILAKLFNSENLNYAVVLCYNNDDLTRAQANIEAMVGEDKFDSLVDVNNTDNSILLFALHNKK